MNQENIFPLKLKTNARITMIPSCTITAEYLKDLFKIISECNDEVIEEEILQLGKQQSKSGEELDKLKKDWINYLKLGVQIVSPTGTIFIQDFENLEEKAIPRNVSRITIDNALLYEHFLYRLPTNSIKVDFDFESTRVFELGNDTAGATNNSSKIEIHGKNKTWVDGVHKRIIDSISPRYNNKIRAWIHKRHAYLVLVWLAILPYIFWKVHQITPELSQITTELSSFLRVAIFVYIVYLFLFLARILFNAARWLYPYVEFEQTPKKWAERLRFIIWLLFLGMISDFLISKVFPFIF